MNTNLEKMKTSNERGFTEVKRLITLGKLEEALIALLELNLDSNLSDDLTLISANLNYNIDAYQKGLITSESHYVERAKIAKSLLSKLNNTAEVNSSSKKNDNVSSESRKKGYIEISNISSGRDTNIKIKINNEL